MCDILNPDGRSAPGESTKCILGTFDSKVSKVILRSFGAFPIFPIFSNRVLSQKQMSVEQNGPKFGFRGYLLLTVKCSRSV